MADSTLEERVAGLQAAMTEVARQLAQQSGAVVVLAEVVASAIPIAQRGLKEHLEHEISMIRKQRPEMPHLVALCEQILAAVERARR
jgi:hypothetical protein